MRAAGRILIVEDTGERGYAIDRMLVQLRQAGVLRGVRALVFGQFTGGRERDGRFTGDEVMARFAQSVRYPVLAGAPVGHGDTARAVLLGLRRSLSSNRRAPDSTSPGPPTADRLRRPAYGSSARSSTRRILPEMVFGRDVRNSISRGYL